MPTLLRRSLPLALVSGLALSASAGAPRPPGCLNEPPAATLTTVSTTGAARPVVQLAILLDTSGSMQGLIEQAKAELWSIVNDFALARRGKDRARFEVALYEYGKNSIPASEGYLRMILPLTDDLDAVSAELFKLTTNGGEEYCARAIKAATEGLSWSTGPADLRFIVIAGNEPFTQGDVDYRAAVPAAVKRGIIVNTIHCGDRQTGENTNWKDGAVLGEGTYSFIDHNAAAVHVPAPQDDEIVRLGAELNGTYIYYGAAGQTMWARQREQDGNALTVGAEAAVQRAGCKASDNYRNSAWDLVDAVSEGRCTVEEVKADDLPEELKQMSPEDRKAHVEKMSARRAELQGCIQKLEKERREFVEAKRKEMAASNPQTLSSALIAAMREQARAKGFEYDR